LASNADESAVYVGTSESLQRYDLDCGVESTRQFSDDFSIVGDYLIFHDSRILKIWLHRRNVGPFSFRATYRGFTLTPEGDLFSFDFDNSKYRIFIEDVLENRLTTLQNGSSLGHLFFNRHFISAVDGGKICIWNIKTGEKKWERDFGDVKIIQITGDFVTV